MLHSWSAKKTIFRMLGIVTTQLLPGEFSFFPLLYIIIFYNSFSFTRYSFGYSVKSNLGLPQSEILYTTTFIISFPPMSYPIIIIILISHKKKDNFSND